MLFQYHSLQIETFTVFEKLYSSKIYEICSLLKKFSINVYNIAEYRKSEKLPIINDMELQPLACFITKDEERAETADAGIRYNELLISKLKLTDSLIQAAVAHEIGHIIFFFSSNKDEVPDFEEFYADTLAIKLGMKNEIKELLLIEANIYTEEVNQLLQKRIMYLNNY